MLLSFIKREIVLCAAVLAAAITALFVPPSAEYFSYIDFRVLALLLALMLTVAGAKKAGVFERITSSLLKTAKNTRALALVLTFLCFFLSMFITNDVALITVVPLALMTLSANSPVLILTVVMMTIAANLGSMLTPIGNPQNLFLYSAFQMPLADFFKAMLPPAALSAALIALMSLLIKPRPTAAPESGIKLSLKAVLPWCALFAVCLLCVARLLDWSVMLVVVLLAVLFLDWRLLSQADWSLLLTFIAFFIFVGNIKQLPQISALLRQTVAGNEMTTGILLSQVISNVPAAVLLSGFAGDPFALLVGVNLGGLGTPIASMASLISYKQYAAVPDAKRGRYMSVFLGANFLLLALLWLFCRLLQ